MALFERLNLVSQGVELFARLAKGGMCVEQGQHNPHKDYPWHPLCHGFIRYADDYFSVESCRSSSSSLPTNRIPGLAVGVILMISPSTSTFLPSVIVYAAQTSLGLPILEAFLDSLETLFEFLGILPYMEFASPSTRTPTRTSGSSDTEPVPSTFARRCFRP